MKIKDFKGTTELRFDELLVKGQDAKIEAIIFIGERYVRHHEAAPLKELPYNHEYCTMVKGVETFLTIFADYMTTADDHLKTEITKLRAVRKDVKPPVQMNQSVQETILKKAETEGLTDDEVIGVNDEIISNLENTCLRTEAEFRHSLAYVLGCTNEHVDLLWTVQNLIKTHDAMALKVLKMGDELADIKHSDEDHSGQREAATEGD